MKLRAYLVDDEPLALDRLRRLLEETRRRVLAGRAHAFVRLARLPKVLPLYREPCPPRHTWEYSG